MLFDGEDKTAKTARESCCSLTILLGNRVAGRQHLRRIEVVDVSEAVAAELQRADHRAHAKLRRIEHVLPAVHRVGVTIWCKRKRSVVSWDRDTAAEQEESLHSHGTTISASDMRYSKGRPVHHH